MTPAQKEVFDYIEWYISFNGYAPSRQDIADGVGFLSANAAHEHVVRLKKKGYLTYDEGISRSIKILKR